MCFTFHAETKAILDCSIEEYDMKNAISIKCNRYKLQEDIIRE